MKKLLLIFLIPFITYLALWYFFFSTNINKVELQSDDIIPSVYLPISILKDKDFYLDEFYSQFQAQRPHKSETPYYVRYVNNHYVSTFPVVAPLMAVPFYIIPVLQNIPAEDFTYVVVSRIAGAFFAALSVVVVYVCLRKLIKEKESLILASLYAFGTCTFALSSQGLWQHAPTQLFFALTALILIKGLDKPNVIPWAGLCLAVTGALRYPNIVPIVIISFYVLRYHTQKFVRFCLMALPIVTLQVLYNHQYLGSPLAMSYGSDHYNFWTAPFPEGFLGMWFSPSKGLLTYSPIFIFSLIGAWLVTTKSWKFAYGKLFKYLFIACVGLTLLMGRWYRWYGGWSFGYRMAVDIVPFLILLIVPVVETGLWKRLRVPVLVFSIWSVFIQLMGMGFYDGEWHAAMDRGHLDSGWLWSIKNSEMMYYFGKIGVKIANALQKSYN